MKRWKIWAGEAPIRYLFRLWSRSIRFHQLNLEPCTRLRSDGRGGILVGWHSDLLFVLAPHRNWKATLLTSLSLDGEIVTRLATGFGYNTIRGSSSSGGVSAIRAMIRKLRQGAWVFVAGDGPKGPRRVIKQGVVHLAKHSGAAIVPMIGWAKHYRILKRTWDHFVIPRPFTHACLVYGDPLHVPSHATSDQMEEFRKRVEGSLWEMREEGRRFFEVDSSSAIHGFQSG
jgi:lysophospholipid acyltransferase (LPLAT)-like uncharacterized protein